MSDPVTNIEIEDVLSSIRRLVSDDKRTPSGSADAPKQRKVGKLVLTPALRVPGDIDETGETVMPDMSKDTGAEAIEADATPVPTTEPWKDPEATLFEADKTSVPAADVSSDTSADSAAEHSQPEQVEPMLLSADSAVTEPSEPPTGDDADEAGSATRLIGPADFADHFEFIDQYAVRLAPPEPVPDQAADPEEADRANDEPDTAEPDAEATGVGEPDAGETGLVETETASAADPAEIAGADRSGPDMAEDDSASADLPGRIGIQPDAAVAARAAGSGELTRKIEALEAAIGRTEDEWEPDGETGEPYSGTKVRAIDWKDDAQFTSQRARARNTVVEAEVPDDLVADEAILDEEALRELVADIVRQELQGALGERITRNVRKLVRREIHRALAAQSLE